MLAEVVFFMKACECAIFSKECSHLSQTFIHIHSAQPDEGRLDYYIKAEEKFGTQSSLIHCKQRCKEK